MNPQHFRRFRSHVQDEEPEARADVEEYCILLDRYVLVLDGTCFYRQRSAKCRFCILDQDSVKVKLIHVLCDMLEDRADEQRRTSIT
jgi:hypothetical protein